MKFGFGSSNPVVPYSQQVTPTPPPPGKSSLSSSDLHAKAITQAKAKEQVKALQESSKNHANQAAALKSQAKDLGNHIANSDDVMAQARAARKARQAAQLAQSESSTNSFPPA